MALNLEEQEQMADLKAFWASYGKWVLALVVSSVATYAVWVFYQYSEQSESEKASAIFTQLKQAQNAKQWDALQSRTKDLEEKYASTFFAQQAALEMAKVLYDLDRKQEAQAHLEWIVAQKDRYGLVDVGRLRLAQMQTADKQYTQALENLAAVQAPSYQALAEVGRGDVYLAQKQSQAAIESYQKAFQNLPPTELYRLFIALKLNALGVVVDVDVDTASDSANHVAG